MGILAVTDADLKIRERADTGRRGNPGQLTSGAVELAQAGWFVMEKVSGPPLAFAVVGVKS